MKIILLSIALALATFACAPGLTSSQGFRLPDGDAERGVQTFSRLNCTGCHAVVGDDTAAQADSKLVRLGGEVTRVKTYGELVTSIINPSHKIAHHTPQSKRLDSGLSSMELARLNDVMTVTELIDLVAYLQDQYKVVPPRADPYTRVYP